MPAMPIISGAGHDACYMSRVAPTGMVFIPCEDGISHNEIENATRDDCGAGLRCPAARDGGARQCQLSRRRRSSACRSTGVAGTMPSPSPSDVIIDIRNLGLTFQTADTPVVALSNINLADPCPASSCR